MRKEKGFTLIELIIAMSVFIIATTIVSGVFVRAVRTQRQAAHLMTINSDASLIIERIAREIRLGYDFDLSGSSCGASASDIITFTRPKGDATTTVAYVWDVGSKNIKRGEGGGAASALAEASALNASQTKVNRLCFINIQATTNDPWRITAIFSVGSRDERLNYSTDFQTTVSARILPEDIQ